MKMKRGKKRKGVLRNSGGVTIFEVMIALAFFAIIITPVMQTFVGSIRTNKDSREVMVATDVATSIMEGITNKSYEEVVKALRMVPGGFKTPVNESDTTANAQWAFSSINDNYYNMGGNHVAPNCLKVPSDLSDYDGNYDTNISIADTDNNCYSGTINDLNVATKAISHLHTIFGDNPDASTFPVLEENDAYAPDKMLYFGFSHDKYAPTTTNPNWVAKSAYMLYTGIKKENLYFDATVTFVPRAENSNSVYTGGTNTENSEYFIYDVTVKVYAYRYDPRKGTWVERFNPDTGTFDGAPCAIMKSGIPNKNLNQ